MPDDEFLSFLATCRDDLATLQRSFRKRTRGECRWIYDIADCTLRIGRETFRVTPIGTYSDKDQRWLWAWANEDLPMQARESSKRLRSLQADTGFEVFTEPGINVSTAEAHDFVVLGVLCLDAIGMFRIPGVPTVYLAVHRPGEGAFLAQPGLSNLTPSTIPP
jgi:hypothetical protein